MIRKPAVAGRFYDARPDVLAARIDASFNRNGAAGTTPLSGKAVGVIAPHAGYMYSGDTAVCAVDALLFADTYILIGPNHTGIGTPVSISYDDWETPLGTVRFDSDLADRFDGSIAVPDASAHLYEHSLEVQLPLLQRKFERADKKSDFRIFPVCMGSQDSETAREIGLILRQILLEEAERKPAKKIAVLASSDFSHYIPAARAEKIDRRLIDRILAGDVSGFYDEINSLSATLCGFGPIAALMTALCGTCHARLLAYTNSGRISGDDASVVAYAAAAFIAGDQENTTCRNHVVSENQSL